MVLLLSVGVLICAHGVLFLPLGMMTITLSMALAGLHMGMTQGLMGAFIANLTPTHLRGTGFSIYYMVVGISASLSNIIAGILSNASYTAGYGTLGAFMFGFIITCVTFVLILRLAKTNADF